MPAAIMTESDRAERDSEERVLDQSHRFLRDIPPSIREFLQTLPDMVAVLNPKRQIVFHNEALTDFIGSGRDGRVIGLRLGEALHCVNADKGIGGCGTSEFCRTCGAASSISSAQKFNRTEIQECRITRDREGILENLDLRVHVFPIAAEDVGYSAFVASDISHEKRRRALERIFFHDVLNVVSGGLKMYE